MLTYLNDVRSRSRRPLGVVSGSGVNEQDYFDSVVSPPAPLSKVDKATATVAAKGGAAWQWIRAHAAPEPQAEAPRPAPRADESQSAIDDVWASPPVAMQAEMATRHLTPLSWNSGLAMAIETEEAVMDVVTANAPGQVDVLSSTAAFLSPVNTRAPRTTEDLRLLSPNTRGRTEEVLASPTFLAFFNKMSPAAPPLVSVAGRARELTTVLGDHQQSTPSDADGVLDNSADDGAGADADNKVDGGMTSVKNKPSRSPRGRSPPAHVPMPVQVPWWTCLLVGVHEMLGCKLSLKQIE